MKYVGRENGENTLLALTEPSVCSSWSVAKGRRSNRCLEPLSRSPRAAPGAVSDCISAAFTEPEASAGVGKTKREGRMHWTQQL